MSTLNPLQLLESLGSNTSTAGWATNPLLLTLATRVWANSSGGSIARSRVDLYERAIDQLMMQRLKGWTPQDQTDAMTVAECTALHMFLKSKRITSFQEFSQDIVPILPRSLGMSKWAYERLGAGDVLLIWSGLFVPIGGQSYSFYHLTFRDFLAARAIARMLIAKWADSVGLLDILEEVRNYGSRSAPSNASTLHDMSLLTDSLYLLWSNRTRAKWIPVITMLCGVLSNAELNDDNAEQGESGTHFRPDIACSLLHALLHQTEDVSSLGLRLAAHCVGEMPDLGDTLANLSSEIASRLEAELSRISRTENERRYQEFKFAYAAMSRNPAGQRATLRSLIPAIDHADESVRAAAIEEISMFGTSGAAAIPALVRHLGDPSPLIRRTVSASLGAMGTSGLNILPDLVSYLTAGSADVRLSAVRALGEVRSFSQQSIDILMARLRDSEESVAIRFAIVQILGTLGRSATNARDVLSHVLSNESENSELRQAAAEALGSLGQSGADVLLDLMRAASKDTGDWRVRVAAMSAVGSLRFKSSPALTDITHLANDRQELVIVRRLSIWAIGAMGQAAAPALDTLHSLLVNTSEASEIRQAAAEALGSLGAFGVDVLPKLLSGLSNLPDTGTNLPDARIAIARALRALRHRGEPALQELRRIAAEKGEEIPVRRVAIEAIGAMGQAAAPALDTLHSLLVNTSEASEIRQAAAEALGSLGDNLELPQTTFDSLCTNLVNLDEDPSVRLGAIHALTTVVAFAKEALPTIATCLNDPDEDIRTAAVHGLSTLLGAHRELLTEMSNIHSLPNWQVRVLALRILRRTQPHANAILRDARILLQNPPKNPEVRLAVLEAFQSYSLPDTDMIANLMEWFGDSDESVRAVAALTAATWGKKGAPILDRINEMLAEADQKPIDAPQPYLSMICVCKLLDTDYSVALGVLISRFGYDSLEVDEETNRLVTAAVSPANVISPPQPPSESQPSERVLALLGSTDWRERLDGLELAGQSSANVDFAADMLLNAVCDEIGGVSDLALKVLTEKRPALLQGLLKDAGQSCLDGLPRGTFAAFGWRSQLDIFLRSGDSIRPPNALIEQLLSAPHWSVRMRAAKLLQRAKSVSSELFELAQDLYQHDPSPAVRSACEEALEGILLADA